MFAEILQQLAEEIKEKDALPTNTFCEAAPSMSRNPSWFAIVAHDPTNVFLHERIAPQAEWMPIQRHIGEICAS